MLYYFTYLLYLFIIFLFKYGGTPYMPNYIGAYQFSIY